MDGKTAKQFLKRAKYVATTMGFAKHADDIAQEVLLKFVSGKGAHQTIDFAVIDAIRKSYGDNRRENWIFKRELLEPIREPKPIDFGSYDLLCQNDFDYVLSLLKGQDRSVVCLYYLWGFTLREIGHALGVCDVRAHYLKKRAEKVIVKIIKQGEL